MDAVQKKGTVCSSNHLQGITTPSSKLECLIVSNSRLSHGLGFWLTVLETWILVPALGVSDREFAFW